MDILDPSCFNNTTAPFIKADGTYLPCCWASTNPEIRIFLGPNLYQQLNLNSFGLEEIKNSDATRLIIEKISSNEPFTICKNTCSKSLPGKSRLDHTDTTGGELAYNGLTNEVLL